MKFLLDTNAIGEPFRPKPNPAFLKRFRAHLRESAIASITLHEAIYGLERMPEGRKKVSLADYMRDLVMRVPVLPYDEKAAEWHARERARLERLGRTLPYEDSQIAAVAVVSSLVLVTLNARDFRGVQGLTVEDWSS